MRTRRSQTSDDPVSAEKSPSDGGGHQSVLLHEVIEQMHLSKGKTIVDATLGGAGHAEEITKLLGKTGTFVGFDADQAAIARAHIRLAKSNSSIHLVHRNFRYLAEELKALEISEVDAFFFDLGWSSFQLDSGRGFSFKNDEPLLMTYTEAPSEEEITAQEIVNMWAEESIADVLYGWGEERYARKIAKAILKYRVGKPITSAKQLADIVYEAVPAIYRHGRVHPATKTFQALRIAVNDELGTLSVALPAALSLLRSGGRLLVISFHSLEDRIVKHTFRSWQEEGMGEVCTRRPITPGSSELKVNPRARSAKLRVFEKH